MGALGQSLGFLGGPQDMLFFLYKDGNPTLLHPIKSAGEVAEFRIPSVREADRGNYQCLYPWKQELFTWSYLK